MTTEPQLKPIAEMLLLKTRKGEVNWLEEEADDSGTAYAVKLPKAGIVVKFCSPIAEPDYLVLALLDENGHGAIAWDVPQPEPGHPTAAEADWELLNSLFKEARRQATGWDRILKEVQTALASQGPIGLAPSRK